MTSATDTIGQATEGGGGRSERTIPLPAGGFRLEAANPNGPVTIVGKERQDILVSWEHLTPTSPMWINAVSVAVDVDSAGIRIAPTVTTPQDLPDGSLEDTIAAIVGRAFSPALNTLVGWRVQVSIMIEVPLHLPGTDLRLDTASGRLHVYDVEAPSITATAASGKIVLEGCGPDLKAESASGRITIARAAGRCVARSASGKIDIQAVGPLDLSAETASGAIALAIAPGASGAASFKTASGRLSIEAPRNADVSVSTRTVSGRVAAEEPFVVGDRRGEWRLGDGTAWRISAKTISGGIALDTVSAEEAQRVATPGRVPTTRVPHAVRVPDLDDEGEPDPAAPPVNGSPSPPADEGATPWRSESIEPATVSGHRPEDILRAVERGDLGVDEALRLLDDRDGGADTRS